MSKITLETAGTTKKNRFPLPSVHLTTNDVAQMRFLQKYELLANDTVDVDIRQFSDSVPTAVKTFGAFKLRHFAWWCPKRVVWRNYQLYRAGSNDSSVYINPLSFTLETLMSVFIGLTKGVESSVVGFNYYSVQSTDYATIINDYQSGDAYDLRVLLIKLDMDNNVDVNEAFCFKFTAKGRMLWNLLRGLGYNFGNQICCGQVGDFSYIGSNLGETYDALSLLCFARFFYDYVYPSEYLQQQGFAQLFELSSTYNMTDTIVSKVLDLIFVGNGSDFWTSSWARPNQKGVGSSSTPSGTIYSQPSSSNQPLNVGSVSHLNDLGIVQNSASGTVTLSSTVQRYLERFNDFIIRNNIGGTRFNEWLRSHFGFVTADETVEMSKLIDVWTDILDFSGVIAQTGTDSQLLGQRVAIGNSQGQRRIKFDAKEDGYLMIACMVVPDTAYYQGLDPDCQALTSRYDLYTPELDGVDMEPLPFKFISGSPFNSTELSACPPPRWNNACRFAPRYAFRYKVPHSRMTGDFIIGTRSADKDAYHTFRNVYYGRDGSNPFAVDAQFMQADNQYDRIFAVHPTDDDGSESHDKIRSLYVFNTTKWSFMQSYGESLPLMDDENGKKVSIENGGTNVM